MRINDLSAPSGRFIARVTAAVTTDDCRPGRRDNFPAADTDFDSFFLYPPGAARARQKPPLPRRVSPSMLLLSRASHREPTPSRSFIRPRPPLRLRATRHLRLPCRLRVSSPLGRTGKQPSPPAPSHLLLIMTSGPAGPLVHPLDVLSPRHESHGRDRVWPSLCPPLLPPRLPLRYPSRLAATAPSLWELL